MPWSSGKGNSTSGLLLWVPCKLTTQPAIKCAKKKLDLRRIIGECPEPPDYQKKKKMHWPSVKEALYTIDSSHFCQKKKGMSFFFFPFVFSTFSQKKRIMTYSIHIGSLFKAVVWIQGKWLTSCHTGEGTLVTCWSSRNQWLV